MRVIDEKELDKYRGPGKCGYCGLWCRRREPHHHHPRGIGSGSRIDVPENLIALGHVWDCACHHRVEHGNIPRSAVLAKIAERLGKTPEECQEVIHELLRRSKDG